jgi:hypothetical protein
MSPPYLQPETAEQPGGGQPAVIIARIERSDAGNGPM